MNIKNYIDAITNINLFMSFTKEELMQLLKINKYSIKKYQKGEVIHFQNEVCRTMDVILTGEVSVQKIDENGNILTISTFASSDILGANLIFSSKNCYPMTVIAKFDSTILHINKELVLELCQINSDFLIGLISVISDKTITLTDKINSITLKTIRDCIIDFLTYEYHIQKSTIVNLTMSKKELSERLGIQRPSLSRELNKMRKEGLLEYDSKSVTIKDMNILIKNKQK